MAEGRNRCAAIARRLQAGRIGFRPIL